MVITSTCKFWTFGNCAKGAGCEFQHPAESFAAARDAKLPPVAMPTDGMGQGPSIAERIGKKRTQGKMAPGPGYGDVYGGGMPMAQPMGKGFGQPVTPMFQQIPGPGMAPMKGKGKGKGKDGMKGVAMMPQATPMPMAMAMAAPAPTGPVGPYLPARVGNTGADTARGENDWTCYACDMSNFDTRISCRNCQLPHTTLVQVMQITLAKNAEVRAAWMDTARSTNGITDPLCCTPENLRDFISPRWDEIMSSHLVAEHIPAMEHIFSQSSMKLAVPKGPVDISVPKEEVSCKYWQFGECRMGPKCAFKHDPADFGVLRDPSKGEAPDPESVVGRPMKRQRNY